MKKSVLKRIWSYIGKYRYRLLSVFLCAVIGNTLSIFTPLLMGMAIDQMLGVNSVNFEKLIGIILGMLVIYIIGSLFQWMMSVIGNIVANNTVHDIRREAFSKLQRLPLKTFDQTSHGDIVSRLTSDIDAISDGLFQGIVQIMSAVVVIVGSFTFMLTISPIITLIVILITPLCFFIASFISKYSKKMYSDQSVVVGELNTYVSEMIENQKIIKSFSYEKQSYDKFTGINKRLYYVGQKAQWYSSLTNPTTRFINNISYVAVTTLGAFYVLSGGLTVGKVASFLTYCTQFAKPINEITSLTSQIQSAFASAERIFLLLDMVEEVQYEGDGGVLANPKGNVTFEHVSFSYKREVPLIKDLNLTVKEGQTVAIVGPTGSGKTTVVNLLMRFYDINSGNIRIDGVDINLLHREELRGHIGMVLQESWLFSGTVLENIGYGKDSYTREEVITAAKEAGAHGFITRLKYGYDTVITEDGGNLSQGEQQLLTIARVMLMDPAILILDEATSSIDTRTEIKIQRAFLKMMSGRTSFVIAHRLSTIKEADVILVLKDGDIIEQGHHKELLEQKGFYYMLHQSQFNK